MSGCVAVINAGSSSVKFALYDATREADPLYRGQIEGIGGRPRLKVRDAAGATVVERSWSENTLDHAAATHEILETGRKLLSGTPVFGVGHRVVHGGLKYEAPVRLDRNVLADLEQLSPLAPLHQPHNLAPIHAILEAVPALPQVACFDTAFHRRQPQLAQAFAIPRRFSEAGVRRYGFHGLSYEYLTLRLAELYPEVASKRVIFAHLGNGASLCAVQDGRSVASTMGFTAVDGLMMGTRCGSLDAGVLLYLMQEHRMDASAVEDFIYRQSGLLGVSGISSDMRTLRSSPEVSAREAIDLFVYRIVREIGSLVAALGGVDALVFSGGIGENDAATRAEIVDGCAWAGALLDTEQNTRRDFCISSVHSHIPVFLVPTDEERMVARHTMRLLRSAGSDPRGDDVNLDLVRSPSPP